MSALPSPACHAACPACGREARARQAARQAPRAPGSRHRGSVHPCKATGRASSPSCARRRAGVNRPPIRPAVDVNITPRSANLPQSRAARAWWGKRYASLRALRVCGTGVMSCAPAHLPRGRCAAPLNPKLVCSRVPRQHNGKSGGCAARWDNEAPARPAWSHSRGFSPAGLRSRARCARAPVRPRQRGLPESEDETPTARPACSARPTPRLAPHVRACFFGGRQG